ncbi:MAG: septal ring lytic transglycosylase RlpA family protein, partial [Gemmatimonadaceae bacterium]|nr:septal ring lytic transglycosylase RlpA family protein [Gemmatimonadaceae bacterium]
TNPFVSCHAPNLSKRGASIKPGALQIILREFGISDTAQRYMDAFLRSPQFRAAANSYGRRQSLVGFEETGMAVEAAGNQPRMCDGSRSRDTDVYAAAYNLPCRTKIRVTTMSSSVVLDVLDRSGSAEDWSAIKMALSPAAMRSLGLVGKGEISYTILGLPE